MVGWSSLTCGVGANVGDGLGGSEGEAVDILGDGCDVGSWEGCEDGS